MSNSDRQSAWPFLNTLANTDSVNQKAEAPPVVMSLKEHHYAEVRDRARNPRGRQAFQRAAPKHSRNVLQKLGPEIQWVQSFVTDDKIYCVCIAPNEAMVCEHAQQGGFPANKVSEVREVIDPTTAG
jgi:predicted Rdx family selenoprotein